MFIFKMEQKGYIARKSVYRLLWMERRPLDELRLGYIIDGVDYGKAADVVQGKYRSAVFICPGDSLTVILRYCSGEYIYCG